MISYAHFFSCPHASFVITKKFYQSYVTYINFRPKIGICCHIINLKFYDINSRARMYAPDFIYYIYYFISVYT